ncbi:MarR family winged helix-turn-helix transcriptional regulator [Zooshikella ganghwensis]|uniref:MarR family transcriptional regulator n=1 Tax=Zooshikella ganghwensis TaxID=202772 RepID=A0A4P9VUA5_9GAMM|nr:MarR family transcriptional regulator [Zooshikella ganghwensis]RDH45892.1 MarR family transcriptional regulator [Zooshikella ganghwensis]
MNDIEEVLVALRRVTRASHLQSRYLVKTIGLTLPQIILLQTIQAKGKVTIKQIAHEISLSPATVTTIIDRLEKKNLLIRKRFSQDRRKVHCHLTSDGLSILENTPTLLQKKFTQQFYMLEEWEKSLIISALQRIANMMEKQPD